MYFGKPVIEASQRHPRSEGAVYTYGTAGFRMKATLLDPVLFRVGLLAALRSAHQNGRVIGVMITASHNPAADNGVKLVDPRGDMLSQAWEAYATELANAPSHSAVADVVYSIVRREDIDLAKHHPRVVYARDTRPSGDSLVASLADGLAVLGTKTIDLGVQTTPILHYVTRCSNSTDKADYYGEPTPEGYYKKLADAFNTCTAGCPKLSKLVIDCANGVGAIAARNFAIALGTSHIEFDLANTAITEAEKLNLNCGADFVKVNVKAPSGVDAIKGGRYASLDGDADRVVFWYIDDTGKFKLLDGDKIAILAAEFIGKKIKQAGITGIEVGLVQTAYANGNSTKYVAEKLGLPIKCTSTGVKHLHHAAEEFDIGVYFEANGHGTILFSSHAQDLIKGAKRGVTPEADKALDVLVSFIDLVNQTVGDALSDLFAVDAILINTNTSFSKWDSSYTDLPSRLEKVFVKNRADFCAVNAERQLEKPTDAQALIDKIVSKFPNGRSFVRPSGTEDVVRVYSEADTQENADKLAYAICGLVFDKYGGTGERSPKLLDYKKYL